MKDSSEMFRREMIETNQPYVDLARAETRWNTEEMIRDFTTHGFAAPFVVVTRKADGVKGTLEFTHNPRFYFNFTPA
jgi:hypothetical protein